MNKRLFNQSRDGPVSSNNIAVRFNEAELSGLKQLAVSPTLNDEFVAQLHELVGKDNVLTDQEARLSYGRDSLPYAKFCYRSGRLPGTLPVAVVRPASAEDISEVMKFSRANGIRVIPVGTSSGVLGGTIPLCNELVIDLTRLDKILHIDEINHLVTVQAGMNGWAFEEALNAVGWTAGHYPQSIKISTVGGWAACRGGGQASSRYGKIEDIVVGLKVVLPDGQMMAITPEARRAVGPSVKDIFIGSEGVLGVITELTLRIWRKPEVVENLVIAYADVEKAVSAARRIMQAELRPAIVRIYDDAETASRTEGQDEFRSLPVMTFLSFSGHRELVAAEKKIALDIVHSEGGKIAPLDAFNDWLESRYVSLSQRWTDQGYFMDTVEVVLPYDRLNDAYTKMKAAVKAINADVHFGSHWSHVYPDGACQYMTFRLPPMDDEVALPQHAAIWDVLQQLALDNGGSISHHHGVGVFRGKWMKNELGVGLDLVQAIKDYLDPENLVNPGKLGLRSAADAVSING